ncbi:MAG: cell division protein FtsA [Bacteroidales bacterium]|jgi:cell division protein FtsA|nr:cell division protein FtsA [Bacteroidales bacterium]
MEKTEEKIQEMEERKIVVGIDVGTTKIAVFIGEKIGEKEDGSDEIKIIGMGKTQSIGVERGIVKNIKDTVNSIKIAVEQAEKQADYKVKEAFVGIAGHHIKNQQHRGSMVIKDDNHIITADDIKKLIDEQYNISIPHGDQIIDIVPQNYSIDNEENIMDPVGRIGKCVECNFNLITGEVNNIENLYRCVELAGYKVKNLILEPIASAEAVVNDVDKNEGVCLVDIGGGTTDMAIFHEGILRHTYVIPLAGNVITNDIKEGCTIIHTQAEALKIRFGDCVSTPNQEDEVITVPGLRGRDPKEISMATLTDIIKARVNMILDQVIFEIKTEEFEKKLIGGIVLTGGGAMIKHIAQLTEFKTGIATRIGAPEEHLTGDIIDEFKHPMHATGIGLVIKGFQYMKEEERMKAKDKKASNKPNNNDNKGKEEHNETPKNPKDIGKVKPKKKGGLGDVVNKFFNNIISDTMD